MSETNQPDTGETCSASRHVLAIAGDLARDGHCQHIADEPTHCAESMRATVEALWAARREARAMVQTLRDEIDENLRLRELGGALPDENITAMTERLIRERDQFRDAAEMVPGGWKLVPTPVTEDMHVAAANVLVRANGLDGTPQRMLDAMLAAAPQPVITSDPLWPNDGVYPDMQPPATQRDRWMFDQGRLAERRIAARQPVGKVPTLELALFDEFGKGADDRVQDYGEQCRAVGYAAGVAAVRDYAVERWKAEVDMRPLENKHRRTLDDVWRQVIAHTGGDPIALIGPCHDALAALRGEVK